MVQRPEKKVQDFFEKYPLCHYEKGDVLIFAGDAPATILYIVNGSVRQYDISESGDEIVVNVFKPGAFFPMSYAINKTHNDYFFDAAVRTTVRQAPLDEALQFVKSEPEVLFDLLARVYRGTDGLLRRQAHLMGGSAANRLLFELIILCHRFGSADKKGGVRIEIPESELAARTGLTRETVNRRLRTLKSEGLVRVGSGEIVIANVSSLEEKLGAKL
jgi:CRP-like cAMP-binding protein